MGLVLFAHVAANLVWIGSILSCGLLLSNGDAPLAVRGKLARWLYLRLAVPAFVVSFAAGVIRLLDNTEYYFVQTRFMHMKLLFAVLFIAGHHVIGARAKRAAAGGQIKGLSVILGLSGICAGIAAYAAILKPF